MRFVRESSVLIFWATRRCSPALSSQIFVIWEKPSFPFSFQFSEIFGVVPRLPKRLTGHNCHQVWNRLKFIAFPTQKNKQFLPSLQNCGWSSALIKEISQPRILSGVAIALFCSIHRGKNPAIFFRQPEFVAHVRRQNSNRPKYLFFGQAGKIMQDFFHVHPRSEVRQNIINFGNYFTHSLDSHAFDSHF